MGELPAGARSEHPGDRTSRFQFRFSAFGCGQPPAPGANLPEIELDAFSYVGTDNAITLVFGPRRSGAT
jgi:hypothetical protein